MEEDLDLLAALAADDMTLSDVDKDEEKGRNISTSHAKPPVDASKEEKSGAKSRVAKPSKVERKAMDDDDAAGEEETAEELEQRLLELQEKLRKQKLRKKIEELEKQLMESGEESDTLPLSLKQDTRRQKLDSESIPSAIAQKRKASSAIKDKDTPETSLKRSRSSEVTTTSYATKPHHQSDKHRTAHSGDALKQFREQEKERLQAQYAREKAERLKARDAREKATASSEAGSSFGQWASSVDFRSIKAEDHNAKREQQKRHEKTLSHARTIERTISVAQMRAQLKTKSADAVYGHKLGGAASGSCNLENLESGKSLVDISKENRRLQKEQAAMDSIQKTSSFGEKVSDDARKLARLKEKKSSLSRKSFKDLDERIDSFSGIRIIDRTVSKEDMEMHMECRTFKHLSTLMSLSSSFSEGMSDIPGDWVTMGILVDKSAPRTAVTKQKYCVFKMSDLKGALVNVFIFGLSFERHWKETVGGVFAILNPKLLAPSDIYSLPGLDIDNPDKLMRIGTSLDYTFCRGLSADGSSCGVVIDRRKGEYCENHAVGIFKKSRTGRQVFASGTNRAIVGDPTEKKTKTMRSDSVTTNHSSYVLPGGFTISTKGKDVRENKVGSVTMKQQMTPEEEVLLSENSRGARLVRAARGIKDPEPATGEGGRVFSIDAIRKLGFDPVTGKDAVVPMTASASQALTPSKKPFGRSNSSGRNSPALSPIKKSSSSPLAALKKSLESNPKQAKSYLGDDDDDLDIDLE
ncbi:hypothetical protein HDV05_000258 [Chytridiales sp. JEL 0842]|nr:hypothetical protein HDV05_000258 [Chytridiales sp. JEL 0842]